MYKKIRAFLSTILVLSLMIASSTTAFATESANTEYPEGVPEYAEMHEVVIEIPAYDSVSRGPVRGYPIGPTTVGPYTNTNLKIFASTFQNISFEAKGTVVSGTSSSKFSVLLQKSGATYLGISIYPDGEFHPSGNSTLDDGTFTFMVKNTTSATIEVTVYYYLWN